MFHHFLYQKDERDREVAKAEQEKEHTIVHKTAIQEEHKGIERKAMQHYEFQQNKKPRIEEPEDNTNTNASLLNMLNTRKQHNGTGQVQSHPDKQEGQDR
eukprot:8584361-Heterocapsa_arctica.AAC.1